MHELVAFSTEITENNREYFIFGHRFDSFPGVVFIQLGAFFLLQKPSIFDGSSKQKDRFNLAHQL